MKIAILFCDNFSTIFWSNSRYFTAAYSKANFANFHKKRNKVTDFYENFKTFAKETHNLTKDMNTPQHFFSMQDSPFCAWLDQTLYQILNLNQNFSSLSPQQETLEISTLFLKEKKTRGSNFRSDNRFY